MWESTKRSVSNRRYSIIWRGERHGHNFQSAIAWSEAPLSAGVFRMKITFLDGQMNLCSISASLGSPLFRLLSKRSWQIERNQNQREKYQRYRQQQLTRGDRQWNPQLSRQLCPHQIQCRHRFRIQRPGIPTSPTTMGWPVVATPGPTLVPMPDPGSQPIQNLLQSCQQRRLTSGPALSVSGFASRASAEPSLC